MRRSDLLSVGRTHAHQNLVSNTEFTLGYESIFLLYLSICIYALRDDPSKIQMGCTLSPRIHTFHFVCAIMWPTVLVRLVTYIRYKHRNFVAMSNWIFFINAYWNVGYGIWTVWQIVSIT